MELDKKEISIAIVNNKGGVAKTTTAVSLAAGLAGKACQVLLIDLDAQGSASLSLGFSHYELEPGTAAVLLENKPIREAARPSYIRGLDVLTGSMALASADLQLADIPGREFVLNSAIKPALKDYDFIIIDCGPSIGLLTINALTAAKYFLVPVTPDYLALEGLINLMEAVQRIKAGIGKAAELLGFVLTEADYRLNVTTEIEGMIREHYKELVFKTEIKGNVKLKEAPSFGKAIFDYAPGSSGAECYRQLVNETLRKITLQKA